MIIGPLQVIRLDYQFGITPIFNTPENPIELSYVAYTRGTDDFSAALATLMAAAPDLARACEQAYNIMLNYNDATARERNNARTALAYALNKAGK